MVPMFSKSKFFFLIAMAGTAVAGPMANSQHSDGRGTPKLVFATASATSLSHRLAPELLARQYLADHHADFDIPQDLSNLTLTMTKESLLGTHLYFHQYIGNVPVDKADIVVSIKRADSQVYRVFNNTFPVHSSVAIPKALLSSNDAMDRAWTNLKVRGQLLSFPKSEQVFVPTNGTFRLAYRTSIHCDAPFGHWEHLVDAETGEILDVKDRIIHDRHGSGKPPSTTAVDSSPLVSRASAEAELLNKQSSAAAKTSPASAKTTVNGTGLVFDPDPKTTLMSDSLTDTSAASAFSAAYITKTLRDITLDTGVYSLSGPWVVITNFSTPNTAPSTTSSGNWNFQRGSNGFNDVMTYFHIDQSQRYIQSLGFTGSKGIQEGPIHADSDGANGDDNSFYDPAANTIEYGHGGIDDNEDADIILHEYGHSIEASIDPSWEGGDTGAMGEGFGDYWGASYSFSTSNGPGFHPTWFATWDGHNTNWAGRTMESTSQYNSNATYAAHTTVGGVSGDELWSTPLFQSMTNLLGLGRTKGEVDSILLEAHFGLGSGLSMRDMAKVIVQTAEELYPTGIHAQVFYSHFTNRSILTSFPLANPTLVRPSGGEQVLTGSVMNVSWQAPSAPTSSTAIIQYTDTLGGGPTYFQDNVEGGTNSWTVSHSGGTFNWRIAITNSVSPTHAWYGLNSPSLVTLILSRAMTLSNNASLSFWHRYNLESGYDGGVVEISTNGGVAWIDLGSRMTANPYAMAVSSGYGNPIGGRSAFSGTTGTNFVQTVVDLSDFGAKTVNLRFLIGTDSNAVAPAPAGWWIDDIEIKTGPGWSPVASVGVSQVSQPWTVPTTPGTNYAVRIKLNGANVDASDWTVGSAFTVSADGDADGIPDSWELLTEGNLGNASSTSDLDGDGYSDLDEFRAGTSPSDAQSVLTMGAVTSDAAAAGVSWQSASNRLYRVLRTGNIPAGFTTVASNIVATPPTNTYSDTSATNLRTLFYQISVQP